MSLTDKDGNILCGSCGGSVDRVDHVVVLEGGVYCRELLVENFGSVDQFVREVIDPTHEDDNDDVECPVCHEVDSFKEWSTDDMCNGCLDAIEDLQPAHFGGLLNEEGDVYGG